MKLYPKIGEMDWKKILLNLFLAVLIFITGPLGILITRAVKSTWTKVWWSYIPLFWIPVMTSWPVAVAAAVGLFD